MGLDLTIPTSTEGDAAPMLPKNQIQVLSQEIFPELAMYRLLAGQRVRYVTMPGDTFDDDTMGRPYLFITALPDMPEGNWTRMHIEKDRNGFKMAPSSDPLDEIQTAWHSYRVDVLSLPRGNILKKCIYETTYQGKPTIMKIANFEHEIPRIENETFAYSMLHTWERSHPERLPLTPKFLGHLTEHGRVIGFLLEKTEGRFASADDLSVCRALVTGTHNAGLIHGDVNRYNFIINDEDPARSCILDLEHSEPFEEAKAMRELDSLTSELSEETGRGLALA